MDTPQSTTSISSINNKLIDPSSSDSPIVQDSPVFNFISNLSPIQPVKAEPGAQGFPGLASPPLLFTSPRINSLQSLLNRKLLSSGSNLESPQDNDKCQNMDRDLRNLAKPGPECNNLFISKEHKAFSMKSSGQVSPFSPGCIDDFLTDPHANSSSLRKSDAASQCPGSFSLEKKYGGSGKNVYLDGSTPVQFKKGAHAKSRISVKVVKNEARPLMQSSECLGSLPRSFTEHASEVCENGDSLNEASHLERGTLRRCLFEENQKKCFGESEFRNSSDNITRMEKLTNMPATRTADDGEMISLPKPASGSFVSSVTGSYPVAISKPLGIGLHLNSVVYPRVLGSSNGSQQSSLAGLERKNSASAINNHSDGEVNASLVGKVPATSEERYQNKSCSIATSGEAKPSDIEHLYIPVESKPDVSTTIKCVKRKISSRTAESNEEPHQLSPKKKRQKPSSIGEDDNLRRCNCKKSKCLKLYCDCFAAGLYCTESCACQGCCNRHEHEDTVLETRKQIESRNPLAFAPKVVQQVTGSPSSNNEVQNQSTPSSARHKRGCNCKKSMCLKKYCECYQANVGCSEGCRCEGCKNVFGVREDYRIIGGFRVGKAADEMSEAKGDGRQENSSVGSNFVNSRLHNFSNLTPPTPALQCSDLKKNALRLPFMKFLESPDTQNDVLSDDNFLTCPEFAQSHNMLPEKSTECKDEGALHAGKSVEITEDRRETAGDEPTSTSSLVSDSVVASMIPSSSSKANSSRNASQPRFFNESGIQSMSSSLRWRSSPITPIARSTGLEFQDFGSESKHNDISEDDTPDVLKDSSTPSSSVKVRSPHKKRVSAPHNPIDCSGSLESDSPFGYPSESSGSLKLCRRFVLRALPTFPSLTPLSKKQQSEQET